MQVLIKLSSADVIKKVFNPSVVIDTTARTWLCSEDGAASVDVTALRIS